MENTYFFRGREILLEDGGELPSEFAPAPSVIVAEHVDVASGLRAVELSRDYVPAPGLKFVSLRSCFAQWTADESLEAARLKGFVNWRAAFRFCPSCGGELKPKADENALVCRSCGAVHYPRISPCVICIIERGEEILLLRHVQRNRDIWCCLAGFVEAGESLEQCLRREVREEVGLEIRNIRYAGSQSWPFPDQLMVGFYAEYAGGELKLQESEIGQAQWFRRDALPAHPAKGSISWNLIHYENI